MQCIRYPWPRHLSAGLHWGTAMHILWLVAWRDHREVTLRTNCRHGLSSSHECPEDEDVSYFHIVVKGDLKPWLARWLHQQFAFGTLRNLFRLCMKGLRARAAKKQLQTSKHTLGISWCSVSTKWLIFIKKNHLCILRLVFPTASISVPSCIGPERLILPDGGQREKGPHRQIGAQKALERMCHQRCRVQPHATIFQQQC